MVHRSRKNPASQAALLLIASLQMFLAGCWEEEQKATVNDVMGEYLGRLPSGQIERWTLDPSGLLTQQFFHTWDQFKATTPVHVATSSWSLKNNRLWIDEITYFFEPGPPFALLKKPETFPQASPTFWKFSGFGIKHPIIIKNEDTGVIYKMVHSDDPSIRTFGWDRPNN